MKSAILYIRVDKKLENYVDACDQKNAAYQYAIENNINICNAFTDFNDAEPFDQPELSNAINYCKKHSIEIIVMHDYRVLSHKYMQRVINAKFVHKNNLHISFVSNNAHS